MFLFYFFFRNFVEMDVYILSRVKHLEFWFSS